MVLSFSIPVWRNIEGLKSDEQKKLLQWQLQAREPIHRFTDIKTGDHLVRKSSFMKIPYEHHFLCIGFDKGKPKIIHYYNTSWNASMQLIPTSLGSGSAIEQLGIVQEMTLPHKGFIKSEDELQEEGNEVQRVVWPEELRRFSVEEVIKNAEERKGEKWYNVVKNNCETFVMSCLCGLQISPQVTHAIENICEAGSTFMKTARHTVQQALKVGVDFVDDILKPVARNVLPRGGLGLGIGAAVSVLVEGYLAYCDICDAKKKWDAGVVIQSRKAFIKEVIKIVVSATFRPVGSIIGMIAGQLLIPVPVLGGIIGAAVGYLAADCCAKKLTDSAVADWLAGRIDNVIAEELGERMSQ